MNGAYDTHRWRGIVAVALTAGAVGLVADRSALVVVATVGITYAGYARFTSIPRVDLEFDRHVSTVVPEPGEEVTVTVTVRNDGDVTLADLRIVDGVPPELAVVEESPRRGAVLRPSGTVTFSYTVEAKQGRHGFKPATAVVRDLSGASEYETTLAVDTELVVAASEIDERSWPEAIDDDSRRSADAGGNGVEFHWTRDYRPGDPIGRIDWNRFAGGGDLATVEFREERAATILLLVDARDAAYRGTPDGSHAVVDSVAAAKRLFGALMDRRNRIGLSAFGREPCWLAPGVGRDHRLRARKLLATHRAFSSVPPTEEPDHEDQVRAIRERVPDGAHVLLFSPLCDDEIAETVARFDAAGYPVTVISPDVDGDETPGQRLAAVERRNRIHRLRTRGVSVVGWDSTEPLADVLDDEFGRVST